MDFLAESVVVDEATDIKKGRLMAENEALRLALEFYANKGNWRGSFCAAIADEGDRARIVLRELEDE
jgi:hypothetical protein